MEDVRVETHRVKIRGQGGHAHRALGIRGIPGSWSAGWGHGKDAKGGNRIWSQFPRALNVELRSLVFYARQRGAAGGCT